MLLLAFAGCLHLSHGISIYDSYNLKFVDDGRLKFEPKSAVSNNRYFLRRTSTPKIDGNGNNILRLKGGGIASPFPGGSYPNFGSGTMQLPSFGAGPSLYIPLAGLALLVVYGQVSSQVQAGTKGWTPAVRSRVKSTYAHFGASVAVWVASAVLFWKLGLVPSNLHMGLAFVGSIFSLYKVSSAASRQCCAPRSNSNQHLMAVICFAVPRGELDPAHRRSRGRANNPTSAAHPAPLRLHRPRRQPHSHRARNHARAGTAGPAWGCSSAGFVHLPAAVRRCAGGASVHGPSGRGPRAVPSPITDCAIPASRVTDHGWRRDWSRMAA